MAALGQSVPSSTVYFYSVNFVRVANVSSGSPGRGGRVPDAVESPEPRAAIPLWS